MWDGGHRVEALIMANAMRLQEGREPLGYLIMAKVIHTHFLSLFFICTIYVF